MNARDVMMYGQRTVLQTLQGFPGAEWETPGVSGIWSTKDVVAHLASHELVLLDVLSSFVEEGATPTLDEYTSGPEFNDRQVNLRKRKSPDEILAELNGVHKQTLALVQQIPAEKLREVGTLPWYGAQYSLEDYIVYGVYGHKREHSAQIAAFLDRLKNPERGRTKVA